MGERQQRGRNVLVGQLVVAAAERDGQLPLGGERGTVCGGWAARWGGVYGQQVAAGPGGDPGRPADQRLALRAAAKRDHHPLPGVTVIGNPAARLVPLRVAGQRAGQPEQGSLAQHRQVPGLEPAV